MGRFSKLELTPTEAELAGAADSDRDFAAMADKAMQDGAYEPALRFFSRALARDSQLEAAWLGQIICLFQLGEFREAVAWADRALGIVPDSADVLAMKAVSIARQGEHERAMGVADGAMKKSDVRALVWWARGDILLGTNGSAAEMCFTKAAELERKSWQLPFWIGLSYLSAERAAEAKRYFLRARKLEPNATVVSLYLGFSCRDIGERDEAIQAFRHVLGRIPSHLEARTALDKLEAAGPLARAWARLRASFSATKG